MAQFASTLYPQTNPTNPILLAFRDWLDDPVDMTEAASWWLDQFDGRGDSWSSAARALDSSEASPSQHRHARRVLTRLASLSG